MALSIYDQLAVPCNFVLIYSSTSSLLKHSTRPCISFRICSLTVQTTTRHKPEISKIQAVKSHTSLIPDVPPPPPREIKLQRSHPVKGSMRARGGLSELSTDRVSERSKCRRRLASAHARSGSQSAPELRQFLRDDLTVDFPKKSASRERGRGGGGIQHATTGCNSSICDLRENDRFS